MAQREVLRRIHGWHRLDAGRVGCSEHGHELRYELEARGVVDGQLEGAGNDEERPGHVGEG